jgi:glycosyltransferase involved in cell wall biosynthesis
MTTLAFLIPTRDRHDSLRQTLETVVPAAAKVGAEVLICDQSAEPFPARPGVRVLHRRDLPGLPAARNALLAATGTEVVCFLDDDTDLAPDFGERLRDLAECEPERLGWGPVVETRPPWTRRLHRLGQLGVFHDPRRLLVRRADRPTTVLFGCCFAVRRAAALMALFDARRGGYALGEDLDFFLRLAVTTARQPAPAAPTPRPAPFRFAAGLRAHHRRDGAGRATPRERGRAKAAFLVWLARRHGGRNPFTLFHLGLALVAAAAGRGLEPADGYGIWLGLR